MQGEDFNPDVGVVELLAPGLRRILAPNPSPMTYRGTNTYLLGAQAVAVIDPGPLNEAHLDAILSACAGARITHILVTHAHLDHSPLARPLAEVTGAPVLAFGPATAGRSDAMQALADTGLGGGGEGIDRAFEPDEALKDGAQFTAGDTDLLAIWTPGHLCNHMCFATQDALFCGDHVMGWASTLVSPPDGDLRAFMDSCARLRALPERTFYPGHGAPIAAAHARLDWLMAHRRARETALLAQLETGAQPLPALARAIYTDVPAPMLPAAERNLFAHLIDLHARGVVTATPDLHESAQFALR